MGFDTIIANGRVVTATDTFTGDVAITNGKIEATGNSLPREIAARKCRHDYRRRGKICFPRRHRRAYPP
jgi:dihydroorotase-like cyclic amidohydrolase